ncbi:hypothetical protein [Pseudorhodoferax sp. Leaf267]|uniref:hypothetical protein n=1 Tax=Pseudorhodoferax sp. Leaf267 TaxID=1736316 RepID=UPI001910CD0D|nr:hypothetical protein [Pseudorhodoferax sp. Leaf267]
MAAASLARYDGTAGTLVDANIWIDCIDTNSPWHDWGRGAMQACSERSPLHINIVIYTKLLIPGLGAWHTLFDVYETLRPGSPRHWSLRRMGCTGARADRDRSRCRTSSLARMPPWQT